MTRERRIFAPKRLSSAQSVQRANIAYLRIIFGICRFLPAKKVQVWFVGRIVAGMGLVNHSDRVSV